MCDALTVEQVIKRLKRLPKDRPIYLWQNHGDAAWPLTEVTTIIEEGDEPDWIMLR